MAKLSRAELNSIDPNIIFAEEKNLLPFDHPELILYFYVAQPNMKLQAVTRNSEFSCLKVSSRLFLARFPTIYFISYEMTISLYKINIVLFAEFPN